MFRGRRLLGIAAFLRRAASIICTALVGALGAHFTSTSHAQPQEPGAEQCLNPDICPIPYVRLAKQNTEPFLFLGKVVSENHPRYADYESAINSFPNVRSCLIENERNEPQPDLRQIDWSAMHDIHDIDVCVFRIASSIEVIESIKSWLRYHGIKVGAGSSLYGQGYVPKNETDRVFALESHLSVNKFREIIPRSWIAHLIGIELMRNYWITISFSKSGRVVGVTSGGNSILN